jgi:RimJ/RimL family protein N-acetyltransferase
MEGIFSMERVMKYVDRKIADETDANGNRITIWQSDQLASSKAMVLFLRTYAELIEKDFATEYISWSEGNKFNVVYCTDESGKVLGGIAYEYRALIREGWIVLSFTNPDYRGGRINSIMHKYFERSIKERGGHKICSHVHLDNEPRLKAAERAGMKPQFYRMHKWLD